MKGTNINCEIEILNLYCMQNKHSNTSYNSYKQVMCSDVLVSLIRNILTFGVPSTSTSVEVSPDVATGNISLSFFFLRERLYSQKIKNMKNFKIKTRVIKSLMEEEIPSGTK